MTYFLSGISFVRLELLGGKSRTHSPAKAKMYNRRRMTMDPSKALLLSRLILFAIIIFSSMFANALCCMTRPKESQWGEDCTEGVSARKRCLENIRVDYVRHDTYLQCIESKCKCRKDESPDDLCIYPDKSKPGVCLENFKFCPIPLSRPCGPGPGIRCTANAECIDGRCTCAKGYKILNRSCVKKSTVIKKNITRPEDIFKAFISTTTEGSPTKFFHRHKYLLRGTTRRSLATRSYNNSNMTNLLILACSAFSVLLLVKYY